MVLKAVWNKKSASGVEDGHQWRIWVETTDTGYTVNVEIQGDVDVEVSVYDYFGGNSEEDEVWDFYNYVPDDVPYTQLYTFTEHYTGIVELLWDDYYISESNLIYVIRDVTDATLTYSANGGDSAPDATTVDSGSSVTLGSATRSGYAFLGWSEDASASSPTYTAGQTITLSSDLTLYALWTKTD